MPLEGHWERQQTPLRWPGGRRGRVVASCLVALAIATVALLVLAAAGRLDTRHASAGCIDVTGPSTTGAGTIHACGDTAVRTCRLAQRERGPATPSLRARCASLHVRRP
ncbi:MAG: hypothetical protein JOZ25_08250 [Actinobacteria bacterium]|nr:hypothetical protein [Actinomycetota bacterium]